MSIPTELPKFRLHDGEIADKIASIFDLRPYAIEERLKLRNPIYEETAAYGHMGRKPRTVIKKYSSPYFGNIEKEVELFTWEKLDHLKKSNRHLDCRVSSKIIKASEHEAFIIFVC